MHTDHLSGPPTPPGLSQMAELFARGGHVREIRPWGTGNVNDTYLVSLEDTEPAHFILQRLNPRVFREPELVLKNLRVVTTHVLRRQAKQPAAGQRRFELPTLLSTRAGRDYALDDQGAYWRALTFIPGTRSPAVVEDPAHAREVGWALGRFHALVGDLPPGDLADTLPGFHVTPGYLRHFDAVLARSQPPASPEAAHALRFIQRRRHLAPLLEAARARGELAVRPIHGDPKVDNVLMDASSPLAVGMVDLDTVKPGLIHYDLGDCLRSGCNPLGEETPDWRQVRFEPELARAILDGYLSVARGFLTHWDIAYLLPAVRLIAFELGLRFFTDYLEGNRYFKVSHAEHNLARALVQFQLTESLEYQADEVHSLIRELT